MDFFTMDSESFIKWLLMTSLQGSIVIFIIHLLKMIVKRKLTIRWHSWLWMLLVIRLLMPWAPETKISLYNLFPNETTFEKLNPSVETAFLPQDSIEYHTSSAEEVASNINVVKATENDLGEKTVINPWQFIAFLWSIGAFFLTVCILLTTFRTWQVVIKERPLTHQPVLELLEDCKHQMNIHTIIGVIETDKIKSPAMFGFIRPRILLPKGLIQKLNDQELKHIFLHELSHLKRGDIFTGWLMAAAQVLHWFNPLIWFGFRQMRNDRELSCDGMTLMHMQDHENIPYGKTIVSMLENFSQKQYVPSLAGILEDKSQVKRRIKMIADFKKSSYKTTLAAFVLTLVFACVVLTNANTYAQSNDTSISKAIRFVNLLNEEKFTHAVNLFDQAMKKAMPADTLKEAWHGLLKQAGQFEGILATNEQQEQGFTVVLVTTDFSNSPIDIKVVFDKKKNIAGLWFVPTPQATLDQIKNTDTTKEQSSSQSTNLPKVVRTIPKNYMTSVPYTLKRISVGFDRKMMDQSWSFTFGPTGKTYFPEVTGDISYNSSKKVCTLPVKLEPGKVYYISINEGQFRDFKSAEGTTAAPYAIVFATKTKDGKPTKIPESLMKHAMAINESFASDNINQSLSGNITKLSVDDGTSDGKQSLAGGMPTVKFNTNQKRSLVGLQIFGSRYGAAAAPDEDFEIQVFNENLEAIANYFVPYSTFKNRGDEKWYTIKLSPLELSGTFYLSVNFNADKYKGIYVNYDASNSGNSFVSPRNNPKLDSWDKGDWMIRAVLKDTKSSSANTLIVSKKDKIESEDLNSEGWKLWQQRKLSEAEEIFQKAVEKNPKNSNAWNGLGWAQFNQGKNNSAQQSFEQCLTLEPKHVAAMNGLGWILKSSGKTEQAISYWEKAVAINPGATAPLSGLTQTFMEQQQYKDALKYYKIWERTEPDNPDVKNGIQKALSMM